MNRRETAMAIIYDFDGTLAPGRMQDRQFIPETIQMEVDEFWREVDRNTITHQADPILSYMFVMLQKAQQAGITIRRQDLARIGPGTRFFPGVEAWFDRTDTYAREQEINLKHFVISSGNSEIIEETPIATHFERIYASRFLYDQEGKAAWAARAINFINKPNYLYRINKGALDQQDLFVINEFIPEPERAVPFRNMIYIGDGETDVPCFQTIRSQGGLAIAVYTTEAASAEAGWEKAERLRQEQRVDITAPADYEPDRLLENIVQRQIDLVAATARREELLGAPQRQEEIISGRKSVSNTHWKVSYEEDKFILQVSVMSEHRKETIHLWKGPVEIDQTGRHRIPGITLNRINGLRPPYIHIATEPVPDPEESSEETCRRNSENAALAAESSEETCHRVAGLCGAASQKFEEKAARDEERRQSKNQAILAFQNLADRGWTPV